VCTRFHLSHPWWIPVKFIGELRAIVLAYRLHKAGPCLIAEGNEGARGRRRRIVLVSTAAPDCSTGSMLRYGSMVRDALEQVGEDEFEVEKLNLAPTQAWLQWIPSRLRTVVRYAYISVRARRLLPRQREATLHLLDGSHAFLFAGVRALSVPLVITVHDLIPALRLRGELGPYRTGWVGKWVIQKAIAGLGRAHAWVADSGHTKKDLIRITGVQMERVHVAYPAVIPPDGASPAGEVGTAPPYVLHVAGNNVFYKNRQGVIDIFRIIHASQPMALKMVGMPPDAALLEKVESSGVGSAVEFLSHVSEAELSALYRGASFLLFPSLYEGFGWPPLEAMAQGCPVVCSNAGSLSEVVGDAALTAPPGELGALAEHGLQLLRDSELRRRQVHAGFQHVRSFTAEALATELIAAYTEAEKAWGSLAQGAEEGR